MSRRRFIDYKNDVRHALGNAATEGLDIDPGVIVNDALEHLGSMHEWTWASTNEVSLSTQQDVDHVALPADFGTIVAIEQTRGWYFFMTPVTWSILLWMRRYPLINWTGGYYYTIVTGNSLVPQDGLSTPTLELYPTPSETDRDAIRLVYRRHLRRLENDTDTPQIPAYMDRPLSLLARSFASVDYEDDPESAYTAQFRTMISDAMYRDGLSLGSVGIPSGALNNSRHIYDWGYPYNGITSFVNRSTN